MSAHGRFIWYELMTPDTDGAKAFYSKVLPWDCNDTQMPGYTIVGPGAGVGGIIGPPDGQADIPPHWTGYVAVDDVDASVAKARSLGGTVTVEPTDIPGVGRFAVLGDPAGALVAIMKPAPMDGDPPRPAPGAEGTVGWHELYGAAPDQGFGFYAELFGWTKSDAMDMGEGVGTYQLFNNPDGQVGAMMKKPANVPMAAWVFYFRTGRIQDAARRVAEAGGQVTLPPMEVPGGDWVLQAADPRGATFALMGKA